MTTTLNASTAGAGGFIATGDNSGSLALQTNGTTTMTLDTSGNVGIGTTSPAAKLAITATGDGTFNSQVVISPVSGANPAKITFNPTVSSGIAGLSDGSVAFYGNGANTERMRIDSSGNVCVNSTSPVQAGKVTVSFSATSYNGLILSDTNNQASGTYLGFANGSTLIGSVQRVSSTNAVAYNTTSDERLKSNIADSQSVLDKLMTVKVRQYDWTEGQVHQDYGFIAQELEPVFSGIVTKGKTEEDIWQLDYSKLTPHLVKAIQELKAINDQQAETINALTARVVALESKVGV